MALTAKKIAKYLKKPRRRYIDGGDLGRGLYLQVTEGGASWLFKYEVKCAPRITNPKREGEVPKETNRRERWLGLGSLKDFSLKEARDRARTKRQLLADGVDPLDLKQTEKKEKDLQPQDWPWVTALDQLDRLGNKEPLRQLLKSDCKQSPRVRKYLADLELRTPRGRGRPQTPAYMMSDKHALLMVACETVWAYVHDKRNNRMSLDDALDSGISLV